MASEQQLGWRTQLDQAMAAAGDKHVASYFQLATVDPFKGAQVRTVVFRGFVSLPNGAMGVLIATDARSSKVAEIKANPNGQICWYFSDRRIQFRLSGELSICEASGSDKAKKESRMQVWRGMSAKARTAFFHNAMGELDVDENAGLDLATLPPNFVVITMSLASVEVLDIAESPHRRWRYSYVNSIWQSERVAL